MAVPFEALAKNGGANKNTFKWFIERKKAHFF